MIVRSVLLATALLAATAVAAFAGNDDDMIAAPVLRATVTVSDDVVRIGDVIDNAGTAISSRLCASDGAAVAASSAAARRRKRIFIIDSLSGTGWRWIAASGRRR